MCYNRCKVMINWKGQDGQGHPIFSDFNPWFRPVPQDVLNLLVVPSGGGSSNTFKLWDVLDAKDPMPKVAPGKLEVACGCIFMNCKIAIRSLWSLCCSFRPPTHEPW